MGRGPAAFASFFAALPRNTFSKFAKWNSAAGANTVSYTHLRAHETGRNLVCRLLLEKKKEKKVKLGDQSLAYDYFTVRVKREI